MRVKNNQSGQVAIVILLIMVVLLTVGLSLASRTTQEVFLSTQEAESARVFNAAESGVEDALSEDFSGISAEYTLPETSYADNVDTTTIIYPNDVLATRITEGSTVHIALNSNNDIEVQWSGATGCEAASLVASIYYDDGGTTKVVHDAFGPDDCLFDLSRSFDEFTAESETNEIYTHIIDVSTLPSTPLFARIKAIYNDTNIRVSGLGFPTQYFVIQAEADNILGDENRTIQVGRTLSTAPGFMDYSVYSGGSLQQN